jgi:hypothetical protein
MHMLYHVPEPAAAVRELRRITRPRILGPGPVEDYVRSMMITEDPPDPQAFAAAVGSLVPSGGTFRVRTHSGCLICS